MTPHDSGESGRGPARQNPRQFRVTRDTIAGQHDSALSPGDRADKPSPPADESRYVAAAQAGATQQRLHRLQADPITAPVVQRIYREYLAGSGIYAIAERLTRDGILSPSAADPARPGPNRHVKA